MCDQEAIYLDDDGLAAVVSSLRSQGGSLDEVVVTGSDGQMGYKMDSSVVDLNTNSASSLTTMSGLINALATALASAGVSVQETDNAMVRHTGGDQPI